MKKLPYISSDEFRQNLICGMWLYSDENLVGCVSHQCHSILPRGSRRLLQSISYGYQIFKDIIATKFSRIPFRVWWHFWFRNHKLWHNVTYQSMTFLVSKPKCHSLIPLRPKNMDVISIELNKDMIAIIFSSMLISIIGMIGPRGTFPIHNTWHFCGIGGEQPSLGTWRLKQWLHWGKWK